MKNESIAADNLEALSQRGRAIYDRNLKTVLEPKFNGQEVAIHIDSGDYEVGPRSNRPSILLRRRHPEGGAIMSTLVGPPRLDDTLAYRMLLSQEQRKPLATPREHRK